MEGRSKLKSKLFEPVIVCVPWQLKTEDRAIKRAYEQYDMKQFPFFEIKNNSWTSFFSSLVKSCRIVAPWFMFLHQCVIFGMAVSCTAEQHVTSLTFLTFSFFLDTNFVLAVTCK